MQRSFFLLLLLVIAFCSCKHNSKTLPTEVQGFPVDNTLQVISDLPGEVDESSGIINWNGSIWTHNDSKKQADLFEINPTNGQLISNLPIANLNNEDWEEVAQDEEYIYIGDFGNNHGTRKNLKIFKVAKQEILTTKAVQRVDTIHFTYPDQINFKGPTHGHNYDCEAMITVGDSLYLFTKNFKDQQSRLYSLPKTPGRHAAQLKERFDTKGTITGASINRVDRVVGLSGYFYDNGRFLPFVWWLWDYPEQSFFSGKQQRINLPHHVQVEGICYDKEGQFFISSESSMLKAGQLFRADATQWMK